MPTLKGKWYFKDTLDKGTSGTTISTNISFSYFVMPKNGYSNHFFGCKKRDDKNHLLFRTLQSIFRILHPKY